MTETEEFLAHMLPRQHVAEVAMHDGNAEPRSSTWSHNDPVTLFGAWLTAAGWTDVNAAFHRVAARFSHCESTEFELVAAGASRDLAYTVGYEHTSATHDGTPTSYVLRVTHVYRREDGEWRIVHRHGDALTEQPQ